MPPYRGTTMPAHSRDKLCFWLHAELIRARIQKHCLGDAKEQVSVRIQKHFVLYVRCVCTTRYGLQFFGYVLCITTYMGMYPCDIIARKTISIIKPKPVLIYTAQVHDTRRSRSSDRRAHACCRLQLASSDLCNTDSRDLRITGRAGRVCIAGISRETA